MKMSVLWKKVFKSLHVGHCCPCVKRSVWVIRLWTDSYIGYYTNWKCTWALKKRHSKKQVNHNTCWLTIYNIKDIGSIICPVLMYSLFGMKTSSRCQHLKVFHVTSQRTKMYCKWIDWLFILGKNLIKLNQLKLHILLLVQCL